jgi:competence protein ComEA
MFPLNRWHAVWAAGCAAAGVVAAVPAMNRHDPAHGPVLVTRTTQAALAPTTPQAPGLPIFVHVSGEVAHPGLYRLGAGARVMDAVTGAGGATANANLDLLNLAARLEDGQKLRIPRFGEQAAADAPPAAGAMPEPVLLRADPPPPIEMDLAPEPAASAPASGRAAVKFKHPGDGTVHLNSASSEDLQRLPGVGPSTADKITAYRDAHAGFKTVDELMEVKGIGPKKLAKMRPFVAVQ